jgi:hypothetical protein
MEVGSMDRWFLCPMVSREVGKAHEHMGEAETSAHRYQPGTNGAVPAEASCEERLRHG